MQLTLTSRRKVRNSQPWRVFLLTPANHKIGKINNINKPQLNIKLNIRVINRVHVSINNASKPTLACHIYITCSAGFDLKHEV